jgi:multicomponent Na+:H+ antiporter subunit B
VTPHLDSFFLVLMVVSAVAALTARDLLAAVIVLAAFSFFSATFFASLGALDVAFTEAAVGAGITTVLFVTAVFRTERGAPSGARRRPTWARLAEGAALALGAAVLFVSAAALPDVGDPASPPARHVSPRYIERGPLETGAPNLVTGVLADYRGYDTLGETVVIFTAGLACLLVLGAGTRRQDERR